MAKELSKQEVEPLNELEKNMDSRLRVFKKEMIKKTKEIQQKELLSLKKYVEGCHGSEIDDTLINIRYCEGKIVILESIIRKDKIL